MKISSKSKKIILVSFILTFIIILSIRLCNYFSNQKLIKWVQENEGKYAKTTHIFLNGLPEDLRYLGSYMIGETIYLVDLEGANLNDISLLGNYEISTLILKRTNVKDITSLNLLHLESLDLSYTKVEDVKILEKARKLKNLYILNSTVSKEQIESLKQKLPTCVIQ